MINSDCATQHAAFDHTLGLIEICYISPDATMLTKYIIVRAPRGEGNEDAASLRDSTRISTHGSPMLAASLFPSLIIAIAMGITACLKRREFSCSIPACRSMEASSCQPTPCSRKASSNKPALREISRATVRAGVSPGGMPVSGSRSLLQILPSDGNSHTLFLRTPVHGPMVGMATYGLPDAQNCSAGGKRGREGNEDAASLRDTTRISTHCIPILAASLFPSLAASYSA
jgi:hypothetical protein